MLDRTHDYTSYEGAEILARHITNFWATRGKQAHVYTFQEPRPRGSVPLHNVRSRMVGGWP